jgi:hypothetical protein
MGVRLLYPFPFLLLTLLGNMFFKTCSHTSVFLKTVLREINFLKPMKIGWTTKNGTTTFNGTARIQIMEAAFQPRKILTIISLYSTMPLTTHHFRCCAARAAIQVLSFGPYVQFVVLLHSLHSLVRWRPMKKAQCYDDDLRNTLPFTCVILPRLPYRGGKMSPKLITFIHLAQDL